MLRNIRVLGQWLKIINISKDQVTLTAEINRHLNHRLLFDEIKIQKL